MRNINIQPIPFRLNGKYKINRNEVNVFCGSPRCGKTNFIIDCAVRNLHNDIPSLVISTELSTTGFLVRLLLRLSGINMQRFLRNELDEFEEQEIYKWKEWIKTRKMRYVCAINYDPKDLNELCFIAKEEIGIEYVFYDQLTAGELSDNLASLVDIADNFELTVVATSSSVTGYNMDCIYPNPYYLDKTSLLSSRKAPKYGHFITEK